MSDKPLLPVPSPIRTKLLPIVKDLNQQRREAVGRVRSVDMIRWDGTPYGEHPLQCMFIHELNDLCPRDGWPTVVLIHGGGWKEGSKREFASLAPKLARHGLMCAAIDYRLIPEAKWPDPLDDVISALAFLRKQQVDRSRIVLWGFSAGAHLALMAAHAKPDWIRAVVAVAAPTDLEALPHEDTEDLCQRAQLREASPLWQPQAALPPRLLIHGSNDRVCPVASARTYAQQHGADWLEVKGGDHGLRRPLFGALRAHRHAEKWLVEQMALPKRLSKWKNNRKKSKKD